ncbi:MAG: hypothetical protein BWK80_04450 [Desulfobacteraceae bacterium IS3]|nr:MAG: hypothetical protein BWK80_04450 [Desulfobacteraceae bacterium IS3]
MMEKKVGIRKVFFKMFFVLTTLLFMFGISSCAINKELLRQAQDEVGKAKEHLDMVKRCEAEKIFPENFEKASKTYNSASELLNKQKVELAVTEAKSSTLTSQEILKQYFLDEIAPKTKILKDKFQKEVAADPDSLLKETIPDLDNILDYADELEKNRETSSLLSLKELSEKLEKFNVATLTGENIKKDELKSDFSFELGSYLLSEKGKTKISYEISKVIEDKDRYRKEFPDKKVKVTIKIVGYTDAVGFNEAKSLFQDIKKWVEEKIPPEGIQFGQGESEQILAQAGRGDIPPKDEREQRRQFLNQCLSMLRAKAISSYIKELIMKTEADGSAVTVDEIVVGNGENLPPGVESSDKSNDESRRICKVYTTMILHQ